LGNGTGVILSLAQDATRPVLYTLHTTIPYCGTY